MTRGRKPNPTPGLILKLFILTTFEKAPSIEKVGLEPPKVFENARGRRMYYVDVSADRTYLEELRRVRAVPGERVVCFHIDEPALAVTSRKGARHGRKMAQRLGRGENETLAEYHARIDAHNASVDAAPESGDVLADALAAQHA